jgi:uncharacterized protein (TIGR03083 family)
MSEIADLYCEGRERLVALAADVDDDSAARPVPTCPGWTVRDVYAHLAGLCADVLAGRMEGVATDPWTARQVTERADRSLPEIVEEWSTTAPVFEDGLRAAENVDARVVIDQWTHEQDIRGALRRPGAKDAPAAAFVVRKGLGGMGRGWADRGLAPVRVVASSREWLLGEGEPVATMQGSDFTIARTMLGRRSRRQALALWDGDGEPFVDALLVFHWADHDIDE